MLRVIVIIVLLTGCAVTPIQTKAEIDRQTASDEYDECLDLVDEAMEAGVDIPEQCIYPETKDGNR